MLYKGALQMGNANSFRIDGNNDYFFIAYGIVKQEGMSNWAYFFRTLRLCLEGVNLSKMTFILLRHKV